MATTTPIPTPPIPPTNAGIFPGYRGPRTGSDAYGRRGVLENTSDVGQTPSWWTDYRYSGAYEPGAEAAMAINQLIPYMSPIDRKYWTGWLYNQDTNRFAAYEPGKIAEQDFGNEGDLATRGSYTSADRARSAWKALSERLLNKDDDNPANDATIGDLGPAVPWLQRVFGALQQYDTPTVGDRRTRAQERALQNELNQFWSEAQGSEDLQPYLDLAKRFAAPSFKNAPVSTPTPMGARESAYQQPTTSWQRNSFVSNPRYI